MTLSNNEEFLYDFEVKIEAECPLESGEPDHFVTNFKVTLLYDPSDECNNFEEVGYIVAFRIRLEDAYEAGWDPYDVMDEHSAALENYVSLLLNADKEFDQNILDEAGIGEPSEIFVIHICVIHPKVRGKGLGLHFMKKTIQLLGGGCDLVLCKPYPLKTGRMDFLEFPEEWLVSEEILSQATLQKYWAKAGFVRFGGSEIYRYEPFDFEE